MTFHINADSLDDIHEVLIQDLLEAPDFEAAPRGQKIKELFGASFTLTNPRARRIASRVRNVNYGFAVGEFCWYARGDNELEPMAYYNKRMPSFSNDGKTLNSAYGARMFNDSLGIGSSQWDNVLTELMNDPDSRRAIMPINLPRDLRQAVTEGSKDVPCTLGIQLLIRDRRLNMSVTMRSNDVWWGLPYDVFSFTMLQECFMLELREAGCPVDDIGSYHHHAASLHLYERHFELAGEVVKETSARLRSQPMDPLSLDGVQRIVEDIEPEIRKGGAAEHVWLDPRPAESWMIEELRAHRNKRLAEEKK